VEIHLSEADQACCLADHKGDTLDAVLAMIQAAWAYQQRDHNYGIPTTIPRAEGWIVGPAVLKGRTLHRNGRLHTEVQKMVDSQQLPLFSLEPQSVDDLDKRTPLVQTLPFFEQYLRQEGKSEHAIKAFLADIVLLGEHGGMETSLQAFQTPALNAFLNWMEHERGVPCSRKTYARRVTSLKVFFKWLRTIHVLAHDPAKLVVQRNQEAPLSYALTALEIQEAIRFSQTMRRKDGTDRRPSPVDVAPRNRDQEE
jgi:hypothetical protein